MKAWLTIMIVALAAPGAVTYGAEPNKPAKPVLRIVFFTPSDVEPPEGAKERMKQIADYAQSFFGKWMKHWGYACDEPLAIRRDKNGYPEILFVKGRYTHASGRYKKLGFQMKAVQSASRKYGIQPKGQVWWIFLYKTVESGWGRGGGNFRRGGIATAGYYTTPGAIKTTEDLADGLLREIMLKGCIHELGHALGLPHIGPKDGEGLGNTLMGPVNKAYAARKGREDRRVYLSEASAAMLWKHPLFTGSTKDRGRTPSVKLLKFEADQKDDGRIEIAGKMQSDYPAHSVIVANVPGAMRTSYWTKTFVGKVAKDGSFRVLLDELERTDGSLKTVFCFGNGAIVGQGDRLGLDSGFVTPYRFQDGAFRLQQGHQN